MAHGAGKCFPRAVLVANLFGKIRQVCPYCCDDIEPGQAYEIAVGKSPIEGMTIHSDCARQRERAMESQPKRTDR